MGRRGGIQRAFGLANETQSLFTPGHWGFMEGWPRGSHGPVFDVGYGDMHVARLYYDRGRWAVTLRPTGQITCELSSLLNILSMIGDRLQALDTASAAADIVAEGPFCLIDERGRAAASDMEQMAKLLFAGRPPTAESLVRWGEEPPAAPPAE